MQTQASDSEDWSPVAVVLQVGDEQNDKKGQLKIAGTSGNKGFLAPHWALMQLPLMRKAPEALKAEAKDRGSEGVTVEEYAGKEKLKAAGSVQVNLDTWKLA